MGLFDSFGWGDALVGGAIIGSAALSTSQGNKAAKAQAAAAAQAQGYSRDYLNYLSGSEARALAANDEARRNALQASAAAAAQYRGDLADANATYRQDVRPFTDTGTAAVNQLRSVYVDGSTPYQSSPGYDWRLQQGVQALDRSAAARGRLGSGAQQKALTQYGQNVAAADYNDNFNRLSAMAGYGGMIRPQQVAGPDNSAASIYAATNPAGIIGGYSGAVGGAYGGMGNAVSDIGQARASSYVNAANQANSGINNLLSMYYMRGAV